MGIEQGITSKPFWLIFSCFYLFVSFRIRHHWSTHCTRHFQTSSSCLLLSFQTISFLKCGIENQKKGRKIASGATSAKLTLKSNVNFMPMPMHPNFTLMPQCLTLSSSPPHVCTYRKIINYFLALFQERGVRGFNGQWKYNTTYGALASQFNTLFFIIPVFSTWLPSPLPSVGIEFSVALSPFYSNYSSEILIHLRWVMKIVSYKNTLKDEYQALKLQNLRKWRIFLRKF